LIRFAELLRTLRGLETFERIGTTEAAAVLKKLAEGPPGLRPTREAHAAAVGFVNRMQRECAF